MRIAGACVLHAAPDRVWAAITDPAVLAAVIPGCDVLTPISENRFSLAVTLGVAAIKGAYSGEVSFSDLVPPATLTMRATGSGAPGTIDTTVAVTLTDLTDGTTRVEYDADAMVGGMVGGVGQRVLAGVAKKTAGLFFTAIDDVLTGVRQGDTVDAASSLAVTPGAAATGTAPVLPEVGPAVTRPASQSMLGAAAFGALSMMVGVLVGARIARRRS